MLRLALLSVCCSLYIAVWAQSGNMILVKKKQKTIYILLPGTHSTFKSADGQWHNAVITSLKNDTVFFREQVIRQVPAGWGAFRLDTMSLAVQKLHFKDLVAFPRKNNSFSYIKNGNLLMIGSVGFIGLNIVNGQYLDYSITDRKNLAGLLAAVGVFGVGKLLRYFYKPYITIQRRYSLTYISN